MGQRLVPAVADHPARDSARAAVVWPGQRAQRGAHGHRARGAKAEERAGPAGQRPAGGRGAVTCKEGLEMVEEKARLELGMVKPNEIYVQIAK